MMGLTLPTPYYLLHHDVIFKLFDIYAPIMILRYQLPYGFT